MNVLDKSVKKTGSTLSAKMNKVNVTVVVQMRRMFGRPGQLRVYWRKLKTFVKVKKKRRSLA